MINVSSEHVPMNANAREDAERRIGFALRSTANDATGRKEMYGCQLLYANLLSCHNSNTKNQTITTPDAMVAILTANGHCGWSVRRCSWILRTAMAASIPK